MINFSELLWKPQPLRTSRSSPSLTEAFVPEDRESELRGVAVENVRIRPEAKIVLATDPRSPGADRFRLLKGRLCELKGAVKIQKLLITSPQPQDGKSTVVLNLATALAEQGRRNVLVVEADLYQPSLAKRLDREAWPGLAECLEGELDPMVAIRRIEPLGWYLLPAGQARGNPSEILQSEALGSVIGKLAHHFDWILIDTPPVGAVADAVSVARHADASVLVVRADRTPQEAVKSSLAALGPKHVLGIVFNAIEKANLTNADYGGYYSQPK